jgi:hypothetical protein
MAVLTTEVQPGGIVMRSTRPKRSVRYVRHGRDADGDLIMYFVDPCRPSGGALMQSSPIVGLRRVYSAVIDLQGGGAVGRYVVRTCNTDYEVQMSPAAAEQLAVELGTSLPSH